MTVKDSLALLSMASKFDVIVCGNGKYGVKFHDADEWGYCLGADYDGTEWSYYISGVYNNGSDYAEIDRDKFSELVMFCDMLESFGTDEETRIG